MKLLSDKIQDFMDWLEDATDFSEWDEIIKVEVHKKLIEFMTSEDKQSCPYCKGKNTNSIYRPEVYEFSNICRDCDRGF